MEHIAWGSELNRWGCRRQRVYEPNHQVRARPIREKRTIDTGARVHCTRTGGLRQYDVTPDGTRFLIKKTGESTAGTDVLVVVQHLEEELKRLLPRK